MNLRKHGVLPGYYGREGWHPASEGSRSAVARAMGLEAIEAGKPTAATTSGSSCTSGMTRYANTLVLGQGETRATDGPSELRLEDGSVQHIEGYLPRTLPLGYHELVSTEDGTRTRIIISPSRCYLPDPLKIWGWAVQLYAARSQKSWGMGDLSDLKELGRWSAQELGAGMMMLNPLHAAMPILPQQPSPYYPSSRLYRNPIYLRIEDVPGAESLGQRLGELKAQANAALRKGCIDRDAVFSAKMAALEELWNRFGHDVGFDAYLAREGAALETYATFCTLCEKHGVPWQNWPSEYRDPGHAEVRRFADAHRNRVRFHQWLQWLVDEQLREAGKQIPLVADLAIGIDPSGADAWAWQDLLADGMEVGAPPDEFNTQGQKWGLRPFVPHHLAAVGYEPFVRIVRSNLAHMGGLRLDHVMGLFRLYWVPFGESAREGVYVRYPALDLLDIVALESERAGAYIVGEDLGTVEDHVRRELAYRKILSYRVMWFEHAPPSEYPVQALATVTTHDLPTIAGLWTGSDLEAQKAAGVRPNEGGTRELRDRLARQAGVGHDAAPEQIIVRTYGQLAHAPSSILSATLEDALAFEPRPNMPGTTDEYPSWCIPLPETIEDIEADPRPRALAEALRRNGS